MESTGCPWQDYTMGISPSYRHDKSQPSRNRLFGLSTQPIWDISQEMFKDWGLGLNLPMVTADEHQAPLCTQRQSTDTTYVADFIHHTSNWDQLGFSSTFVVSKSGQTQKNRQRDQDTVRVILKMTSHQYIRGGIFRLSWFKVVKQANCRTGKNRQKYYKQSFSVAALGKNVKKQQEVSDLNQD